MLDPPVDFDRDHVFGPEDGVVLLEYGDFECPYCGDAYPSLKKVLSRMGDQVAFAFRHFPIAAKHPRAERAAQAAEAAAGQERFWEMHDLLFEHQDALTPPALTGYAAQLGLDVERFADDLRRRRFAPRVREDVVTADGSGVTGTPTFFINGRRHYGAYDAQSLIAAVQAARLLARVAVA
jgi:protein-disulfide isomerase